jgi:hypothetical protein
MDLVFPACVSSSTLKSDAIFLALRSNAIFRGEVVMRRSFEVGRLKFYHRYGSERQVNKDCRYRSDHPVELPAKHFRTDYHNALFAVMDFPACVRRL